MRTLIKGFAERALVWSGVAALHRRRMRDQTLILAYHNVVPDGVPPFGDRANHLPLSTFRAQLDALRSTHDVVPLPDILRPPSGDRPRAAITFDDAYRGAVVHAIPELVRRSMPATIFVAPAFIGGRSFWWDALANSERGGLDPELRDRALTELRGEDELVRTWARDHAHAIGNVPSVACAASEAELLAAAREPNITLGSHTWAHPNLARLDTDALASELARPLEWLAQQVPNPLRWIAYPYGLYNEQVARAAQAAGYEAGLAIEGGWASASAERYSIPRVNIPPGLSPLGFRLRGAGLLAG